ncbi:MAG: GNAT family N-acetyltransferase [Pseudomonadota bacterium]
MEGPDRTLAEAEVFEGLADKLVGFSHRSASEDDVAFFDALYATCHEEELPGLSVEQRRPLLLQQSQLQRAHYRSAFPRAQHWILERHGRPVGRLVIAQTEQHVRLVDISLIPDLRGAGWGGTICQAVLECAGSRNLTVLAHVFVGNVRARRLYHRLGFVEGDQEGMHLALTWTAAPRG